MFRLEPDDVFRVTRRKGGEVLTSVPTRTPAATDGIEPVRT